MALFRVVMTASGDYEAEIESDNRDDAVEAAFDEARDFGEPSWELYDIYEVK